LGGEGGRLGVESVGWRGHCDPGFGPRFGFHSLRSRFWSVVWIPGTAIPVLVWVWIPRFVIPVLVWGCDPGFSLWFETLNRDPGFGLRSG